VKPALADRLCRLLVGCYPPRWKQRYAAELLDVLDQHRAGRRTVLSLVGGALSTHLDPDYRMEVRLVPRLSRDAWLGVFIAVTVPVGLLAIVAVPQVFQNIRESRWHISNGGAVGAIAFSRDQRILVSASGGPPWSATSTLWNVAGPARPRLLRTLAVAPLRTGNPGNFDVGDGDLVFSPNGRELASASGGDQITLWNVSHPARATRIATLTGPRDYFTALAFSPDGNLLAGVTYHGSVRVFRLTGPAGPGQHAPRHPGPRAVRRRPGRRPERPVRVGLRRHRRLCAGVHPRRACPDGRDQPLRALSQHLRPRHGIHLAGSQLGRPQRPHHLLPQRQ
jgi:WD domain, G-beta repeat